MTGEASLPVGKEDVEEEAKTRNLPSIDDGVEILVERSVEYNSRQILKDHVQSGPGQRERLWKGKLRTPGQIIAGG